MKRILILLLFFISIGVHAQSINIDSVKINNIAVRAINSKKDLTQFPAVDSIVAVFEELEIPVSDSFIYIGKSRFRYYQRSNTCEPAWVTFDDKIEVVTVNSHQLNQQTSLDDFKKLFPRAVANAYPVSVLKKKYICCSVWLINPDGSKSDRKLEFFFLDNKLMKVNFWQPS